MITFQDALAVREYFRRSNPAKYLPASITLEDADTIKQSIRAEGFNPGDVVPERIMKEFDRIISDRLHTMEELVAIDLISMRADIEDDYRANDESDEPSMQITLATTLACDDPVIQTGDNSYTGVAYGYPLWAVSALYRSFSDDECRELASELVAQISEQLYA